MTIGDDNKNLTLKAGTLTTGTIASSVSGSTNKATAEIKGNTLSFGVPADTVGTNKEPSATNPGSAYDFDNAADVQLKVTAADTVTFNKGTITNAGTMTVSGTNGVTVEKEVSIANTGDLTFTATASTKNVTSTPTTSLPPAASSSNPTLIPLAAISLLIL